jgi:hypothetical protein
MTIPAWHAYSRALDAIAPLANAAAEAVPRAAPDSREYAQAYAATLGLIRDGLAARARQHAPEEGAA